VINSPFVISTEEKSQAVIVMITAFFLELFPLFVAIFLFLKEKIKRIFTAIGAKISRINSLNL
jgi:hypothetical protein